MVSERVLEERLAREAAARREQQAGTTPAPEQQPPAPAPPSPAQLRREETATFATEYLAPIVPPMPDLVSGLVAGVKEIQSGLSSVAGVITKPPENLLVLPEYAPNYKPPKPMFEKGLTETVMDWATNIKFTPLLQQAGLPPPLKAGVLIGQKREASLGETLALPSGILGAGETLFESIRKTPLAPSPPPTGVSYIVQKVLNWQPERVAKAETYGSSYITGGLLGEYLISAGVSAVFPSMGQELWGGIKEVGSGVKSGITKAGSFVYEQSLEPKIVVPLAKTLMEEEAYFYGAAVEGKTAFGMLKVGITKGITGPAYHGFLQVLPEEFAEVVSFGKSAILPNIKHLGSVIQYNVTYQALRPIGVGVKAAFEPVIQAVSIGKGGFKFLEQAPWSEYSIVGKTVLDVQSTLGVVYSTAIKPITLKIGEIKGSVSFLTQAPFQTVTETGGLVPYSTLVKSWFKPIIMPSESVIEFGKGVVSYGKGLTSFMVQAKWSQESMIGKPIVDALKWLGTAKTSALNLIESSRQALIVPLKVETQAIAGMARFRMDVLKDVTLSGLGIFASDLKATFGIVKPMSTKSMKPWNYPVQKPVEFDIHKIEQPIVKGTGIVRFNRQISVLETPTQEDSLELTHYPWQGFGVSRLERDIIKPFIIGGSTLGLGIRNIQDLTVGLNLTLKLKHLQKLQQPILEKQRQRGSLTLAPIVGFGLLTEPLSGSALALETPQLSGQVQKQWQEQSQSLLRYQRQTMREPSFKGLGVGLFGKWFKRTHAIPTEKQIMRELGFGTRKARTRKRGVSRRKH